MSWSNAQLFMFFILVVACVNYLAIVLMDKASYYRTQTEGFSNQTDSSVYTWITDPQLIYDDLYAGVYDQLTNQKGRTQAKTELLRRIWQTRKGHLPIEEWSVLDAGCGTGHSALTLAKLKAGNVVGMDFSPAMIRQCQKNASDIYKLTPEEIKRIHWRVDSLNNSTACAAGEFTHIFMFYFTLYYIQDKESFFRYANLWTKPGGKLVVEVVNKYKFDPILEAASPFVGFSLQKYSKERINKSQISFNTFDYEAKFELTDPTAEFYETFRFKNSSTVRRQKHVFTMPKIEEVVAMAKRAGWKYVGFQDMTPLGFEYAYLLEFER